MRWSARLLVLISAVGAALIDGAPIRAQDAHQDSMPTSIYGTTEWYRSRPEQERQWRGRLEKGESIVGPAGRTSLTYVLVDETQRLPIYAAHVEALLNRFAGRPVVVYGKLVDLTSEGLGQELWVGAIAPAEDAESR